MIRRRPGFGDASFLACLLGPLSIGALLNALVRPGLAQSLDGDRRASGTGVRSQDGWWEFAAPTEAEHPLLTGFLSITDGQVAMAALGATAVALVMRAAILRERRRATAAIG